MRLLFLDFEATEKTPDIARPIEYAFYGWDTVTGEEVMANGYLWCDSYGEIPQEVVDLTGITTAQAKMGSHPKVMLEKFAATTPAFDFVVAHNANGYDRPLLENEAKRQGVVLPEAKWIDTLTDLPYPAKMNCKKLSHLALDHGIVVDPKSLHGAVGDTKLLRQLVEKYVLNLEKIAHASQAPVVVILALVSYDQRELAKKEAYRWNPDAVRPDSKKRGAWFKRIKDFQVSEEQAKAAKAGFRIHIQSE